jgi:hypothetical protein
VCVHRGNELVADATTDADGRFMVEVSEDVPVRVQVSEPQEIRTESGARDWEVLAADAAQVVPGSPPVELIATTQPQDRVVRVRVVTPDGPVAGVGIRTWPRVLPAEAYTMWPAYPEVTDKHGLTVQEHLTTSPVEVRVLRCAPWCPASLRCVLPGAKEDAPIHEIRLVRERLLRGHVVDESGRAVPLLGVLPTSKHEGSERGWGDITGLDGEFCVGVPESWSTVTFRIGRDDPLDMAGATAVGSLLLPTRGDVAPFELTLPAAEARSGQADADERLGPEAVRVIEAVLRHAYVGERTRAVLLGRSDTIDEWASEARNLEQLKGYVEESALEDLQRKCARPIPPPSTLTLDAPVFVVDERWNEYWHETHAHEAWERFRDRFKGCTGTIRISAVGFSSSVGQAVLHVSEVRGRLNASAYYFVLELDAGEWKVVYSRLTWIS